MEHYVILHDQTAFNDLLKSGIDGIIIPLKDHAHRTQATVSLEALKPLLNVPSKVKRFVLMNRLYHEEHLEGLKDVLESLEALPIDGIFFADLAVVESLETSPLKEKLIYHAETYATSDADTGFWAEENILSVVLARELTLEDIKTIGARKKMPVGFVGHGYLNMFHSRRHLIKTFFEHTHDADIKQVEHKKLNIIEEIRDESYPIYQDAFGTHVFRHKPLASFKYYDTLSDALDFMIIDTIFMKNTEVLQVIKDYQTIDEEVITRYVSTHDEGFYFKKTVYLQEEDKR